ncbi:MAG: hypothetical protein JSS66_19150 [Armatimonadetes bacterium]|nr:hypothetical protein [Armatimonadota bacterium]
MANKKADEPATFAYFAELNSPTPAETAVQSTVSLSEEDQIQENVKTFLKKRPPSPWREERPRSEHFPVFLASPSPEDS